MRNSLLFWRKKILLKNGIEFYFGYKNLAELVNVSISTLTFTKGYIKKLHDALTRAAQDNKNLREQLVQKEAEIEQINAQVKYAAERILIALAGTVCTIFPLGSRSNKRQGVKLYL